MKILFFSHYFPPEGNAPASRVHETCKRWVAAGHEVTVVTCAPNVPNGVVYDGYQNKWTSRETVDGIKVIRVWTYLAANKGTLLRSLNYVSYLLSAVLHSLFMRRPDVIIATSPQFFCGWAGVLAKWRFWRPFVLEVRDIWPESVVEVGAMKPSIGVRVLEWLEQRMYRSATHIVTVGQGYRERLIQRGVPDAKMSVIVNGVDRDVFDAANLPSRERADGAPYVVSYVGTIGMACGLGVVLRAAKKLKDAGRTDVVFQLIGDGAQREELQQQAAEETLDHVVFTGRLPKGDIPKALGDSDACLVHLRKTSLFETVLPSKMFEAMAMRRPVILGVRGDAARVLSESGGGLCITPESEDELIEAVQRLQGSPEAAGRYGDAGYEYVMRRHDRDDLAAQYLLVIECICAGQPAPAAVS